MTEMQPNRNPEEQAGSVQKQPAAELQGTLLEAPLNPDRAGALQAGLAAAFSEDQSVVIGSAGQSVLKRLGKVIDNVPRVALRDAVEEGDEPIVRPKSPEMPQRDSDSRYQLQGEIARGGMGAILKGRDTDLGRDLAIKVLLDQHKDKPEVIQRFVEEAQIGGQLQHPGIAPIYELGAFADKRPFFAMKLVKGETLSKLLGDRGEPTAERGKFIGIFEQICQTMAYAHSRGVIHRDLKPANIMVGAFGEVQVMDWGLAKVLPAGGVADEKKAHDKLQGQSVIQTLRSQIGSDVPGTFGSFGSHTQMGSVMGTPAYMPPEQALGEIDNLDERADVFGLGAILCEILTGKPPYVAEDGTQVYRMASRGKLADCFERLDACGADAELIVLAKHCLELEPKDRPRDAGVLTEQVSAHLASVESRLRETELQRAAEAARAEEALHTVAETEARARAERRAKRLQLMMAAVVLALVSIGGIAAAWTAMIQSQLKLEALIAEGNAITAQKLESQQRERAEKEEERAKSAMQAAESEKIHSLNMLADMQTERGLLAHREGNPAKAALWFANAAQLTPHDPQRSAANHLRARNWLNDALVPTSAVKLPGGQVRRMEFQPQGSLMLTVSEAELRIWDWRLAQALPWSLTLANVSDAAWSRDGTQLAVGFSSGQVQIVEPMQGVAKRSFDHLERVEVLQWSPDGKRLAVGGTKVQIWNVAADPVCESDWPHPQRVFGLTFNRAGTRLATACDDKQARLYAVGDETLPAPLFAPVDHFPMHSVKHASPVFYDDDRKWVTILRTLQPGQWDTSTGANVSVESPPHPYDCDRSLASSADGKWVVAGSYYSCVLWNTEGQRRILPHVNQIANAVFSHDSQSVMSFCWDGSARIWSLTPNAQSLQKFGDESSRYKPPSSIPQLATQPEAVAFSADGEFAAIAAMGRAVIWRIARRSSQIGELQGWTNDLCVIRPSFDGRLATFGAWHATSRPISRFGNQLLVSSLPSGKPAGPAVSIQGEICDACLASDNRSVAAILINGQAGRLAIYDIATGKATIPDIALPSVPLSIDARFGHPQLAVLCAQGQLQVFESVSGRLLHDIPYDGQHIAMPHARAAYSPDGALLVTVYADNRIHVRDAKSGELRFAPLNPVVSGGPCRAIAFSPDSCWLATAVNGTNRVQVWNLSTGEKAGSEMPHPGDFYGLFSVAFSPDGNQILSGHKDGLLRLWDWKSGQLIAPPMRQGGEVYDVKFSADGRYGLAAAGSGQHCWDLATTKLIAPPLGKSAHTLAVRGPHVYAASTGFPIVNLSDSVGPAESSIDTLRLLAELATNQRLHQGELIDLVNREWDERWDGYDAARQTPEAAAEALATAFDAATTDSTRRSIVARALHLNVCDRLRQLRPNDPGLTLALAAEYARAGNRAEFKRLLPAAIAAARTAIEKSPNDESLVRELVQLLVEDLPSTDWHRLEPVSMSADSNCTMTRQRDGSILSGPADTPQGDTYTIRSRSPLRQIAAVRLETIPHESLPNQGQGWQGGNFCLTEVRAELQRADGTKLPLKFRLAASDYVRAMDSDTKAMDGPWCVIDGEHTFRWDIHPQLKTPHALTLEFVEPIAVDEKDELIVHLDCRHPVFSQFRLGCFGISASNDADAAQMQMLQNAIRETVFTATESLASLDLIRGDAAAALQRLQPASGDDSAATPARRLLLAKAHQELGETAAAREVMDQWLDNNAMAPAPRAVFGLFLELAIEVGGRTRQEL